MKIKVLINNNKYINTKIDGLGHLGAHININKKSEDSDPRITIQVSGYNINNPNETKYYEWLENELNTEDEIKISFMSEESEQIDKPIRIDLSSQKDITMIDDVIVAERILKIAYDYNKLLNNTLIDLDGMLSEDDYKKLQLSAGYLIAENFKRLIMPILRKHPEKVLDELKNMPL